VAVTLLVGTRKGAFIFRADAAQKKWQLDGPHFLGNIVNGKMAERLDRALVCGDEVMIVAALSGG
jgi:molybdopterin converting factor small subunit